MKDLGLIDLNQLAPSEITILKQRTAARAVVFDANNQVALLHVGKNGYYKLPGGGIEPGENPKEALVRECMEELGCTIDVRGEIGKIIEYRRDLHQTSYCYLATLVGTQSTPHYTEEELAEEFEYLWKPLSEAIDLVSQATPTNLEGAFIKERDARFLRETQNLLHLLA